MSSARETDAARLVTIALLKDQLTVVERTIKARMDASMLPGAREVAAVHASTGVVSLELPVGTVTKTKPGKDTHTPQVTDPVRFLGWVKALHPHQIVESVDPLYVASLLTKIGRDPDYETCDENGEVLAYPPGVEVVRTPGKASYLMVRKDEGAVGVIRDALASGALSMGELLALPEGKAS